MSRTCLKGGMVYDPANGINGELRELVDAVLPDEFPLNVFYEALRTKLAPTVDSVRGITG